MNAAAATINEVRLNFGNRGNAPFVDSIVVTAVPIPEPGSMAALAMGLVEAGLKIMSEMATFADAGVSEGVDSGLVWDITGFGAENRYVDFVNKALDQANISKSKKYIERLRVVNADSVHLSVLPG